MYQYKESKEKSTRQHAIKNRKEYPLRDREKGRKQSGMARHAEKTAMSENKRKY